MGLELTFKGIRQDYLAITLFGETCYAKKGLEYPLLENPPYSKYGGDRLLQ